MQKFYKIFKSCLLIAVLCVSLLSEGYADDSTWATGKEADLLFEQMQVFFSGSEIKYPGSSGNIALENKVAGLFADSGLKNGEIRFKTPVFLPGKTSLFIDGQTPISLNPMHPTLFRPGNFTNSNFSADLVYLGKGSVEDLTAVSGVELNGSIAVMDFDCNADWRNLLRFGFKGFIFIGSTNQYYYSDSLGKVYGTEAAIPKFFMTANDGAFFRNFFSDRKKTLHVKIEAQPSRQENRFLRDLWVLIPGSDKALEQEVVVITAPMDSSCVVPELAYGAQSSANLYTLIRLFEQFKKNPPARTVLLVALNAHTHHFLGERMLAWNLLAPMSDIEAVRDVKMDSIRVQEMFIKHYGNLNLDNPTSDDEKDFIKLRTLTDTSTGKHRTIKEPIVAMIKRKVNLLKSEQYMLKKMNLSKEKYTIRYDELGKERVMYVKILKLFNRFGKQTQTKLSDLSEEEIKILKEYVETIINKNKLWLSLNREDLAINTANSRIREELAGRKIQFLINLELVWTGSRVGFWSDNYWGNDRWSQKWGVNTTEIAANIEEVRKGGKRNLFIDTMTKRGGLPEGHFFIKESPAVNFFHVANKTSAFALRNVYSDFGRAFCPDDTFENMDKGVVSSLMNYMPVLLRAILDNRNITVPSELLHPQPSVNSWTVEVETFKFDPFSASVMPELPVEGSAVVMYPTLQPWEKVLPPLVCGDVMNSYIALTDKRAVCTFFGIKDTILAMAAFHFDSNFITIDHTIDTGDVEDGINSNLSKNTKRKILALFKCREFPILARNDTSTISTKPIMVQAYIPLSGKLNATPKRYGVAGIASKVWSRKIMPVMEGPVAFFVEQKEKLKLLTDNKSLALNSTEKYPEGTGYANFEELGSDFFAKSANDMSILNKTRLDNLSGVSDELAKLFLDKGNKAIGDMNMAKAIKDHTGYLKSLHKAVGAQAKAYFQATGITNDMLKAVVFYMALMLPFCFFIQKLMFNFTKIEAEMGMFGLLFVMTFILFRNIHPAFHVTKAPEAIFIAFVMGGLGLFVIKILHDRFEGQMQLLFKTGPGLDVTDVGYSTVGQEAMLIGVNNMKRRRMRTTLTTSTIVLVTFTMLAFTSISKKLSPTVINKSQDAPYTGIMFHWPGNSRMDEATVRTFREVFSENKNILIRRWLLAPSYKEQAAPFSATASNSKVVHIDAVLGLQIAEDGFISRIPLLSGKFFTSYDAEEVILPFGLAKALGIGLDNYKNITVNFQNHSLKIAGILNDEKFKAITDLNQRSILPIKTLLKQAGDKDEEAGSGDTESEEETGVFYVDPSALLILPIGMARRFGAEPYSVSIKLKDDSPLWSLVENILTITHASKFFISSKKPFTIGAEDGAISPSGVYYIGDGYRTSIGGLSFLIIPLLISATIILNTMLGSVFERKSEIAVYNAVGLNPTHIGMFFLAESFVYSVIGSVGGYLIGQVLSIVLTKTGWIEGINLNFSSLTVVYVILFTVAVVLLSTIYPSIVATKAAVPSGKRKWSIPDNDGQNMNLVFPFIYQPDLILGIMGYLAEYFAGFVEASFGDLTNNLESKTAGKDDKGRETYILQYNMALAPFDLGVTQRVIFSASYDYHVQAYRVSMNISRLSGQDTNWMTTNKPFLEKLRTYLLHWRNLDAGEHSLFVECGSRLFSET